MDLEEISNMVISPIDDNLTEIYIATSNGEYGRFRIDGNSPDNLLFKGITPMEYINQTQNLIANPNFKTRQGSKKIK